MNALGLNINPISEAMDLTFNAKKTIRAKIICLTKGKQRLLEDEYSNLQRLLHGEDTKLYSANKQQALRYYKKIKPGKEYPLN